MCCWRRSRWRRSQSISVRRGDRVEAGAAIAEMETDDAKIAVAQAEAALAQARGAARRPHDRQAAGRDRRARGDGAFGQGAKPRRSERVLARATDLLERGIATQAEFDQAQTAVEVAEADDQPGGGQSGGRQAAGAAGGDQGGREPGEAGRKPRSNRPSGGCPSARSRRPSAGRIDDVIRNPGDVAGPSAPVISMLPDGAVKLSALRAGSRPSPRSTVGKHAQSALRRLPGRAGGARQLCLARPGIHAAGDLLAGDAAEAGLPGRGAGRKAKPRRCSRGRSWMWD